MASKRARTADADAGSDDISDSAMGGTGHAERRARFFAAAARAWAAGDEAALRALYHEDYLWAAHAVQSAAAAAAPWHDPTRYLAAALAVDGFGALRLDDPLCEGAALSAGEFVRALGEWEERMGYSPRDIAVGRARARGAALRWVAPEGRAEALAALNSASLVDQPAAGQ